MRILDILNITFVQSFLYLTYNGGYSNNCGYKHMNITLNKVLIFLAVLLCVVLAVNTTKAMATTTGAIAVVQNYRGAPFTWERWIKPIIYVGVKEGKTVVCVFNRNITELNSCN